MRLNSLAFRLFASAAAWTLVVMPIAAILLISLYRQTVERSFDARLNVYLTSLVASTTAGGVTHPTAPTSLGAPIFTLPFSGWYWQVKPLDGAERPLFVSESYCSIVSSSHCRAKTASPQIRISPGAIMRQARKISTCVSSSARSGSPVPTPRLILMLSPATPPRSLATSPRSQPGRSQPSGVLAIGLYRRDPVPGAVGLLRVIRREVAAVRAGEAEKLTGRPPDEIMPLQDELNARRPQSNRDIVERARTHVGNLADRR